MSLTFPFGLTWVVFSLLVCHYNPMNHFRFYFQERLSLLIHYLSKCQQGSLHFRPLAQTQHNWLVVHRIASVKILVRLTNVSSILPVPSLRDISLPHAQQANIHPTSIGKQRRTMFSKLLRKYHNPIANRCTCCYCKRQVTVLTEFIDKFANKPARKNRLTRQA